MGCVQKIPQQSLALMTANAKALATTGRVLSTKAAPRAGNLEGLAPVKDFALIAVTKTLIVPRVTAVFWGLVPPRQD